MGTLALAQDHSRRVIYSRDGHPCRIAAASVRAPVRDRCAAVQLVLGTAAPPPIAELRATLSVGTGAPGARCLRASQRRKTER